MRVKNIYCTTKVKSAVSEEIIEEIIKIIDDKAEDYLQIFRITNLGEGLIIMKHKQEVPEINDTYYLRGYPRQLFIDYKLYGIIHDGELAIMFADEY